MFIKYDEYELLELFEKEPIVISDKEAGDFIYNKRDSSGISIMLAISTYEMECSISLGLENRVVFETILPNVEYLHSENEYLRIHQNESAQDFLIFLKPNIFVKTEWIAATWPTWR